MQREEALRTLVAAQDIDAQVRRRGRWYAVYAAAYGAMAFACTLAVGMIPSVLTVAVTMPLWIIGITALSVYAHDQPVAPRRHALLHTVMIGTWGLLYTATLTVGLSWFPGELWWWGTGAALCAVPPLAAARIALAMAGEPRA